jgi:antitoxin VapB
MALSIKTEEADRLARDLARLTGESMTQTVTVALRERLEREQAKRAEPEGLAERIHRYVDSLEGKFDTRPVTKAEWDWASGDEDE